MANGEWLKLLGEKIGAESGAAEAKKETPSEGGKWLTALGNKIVEDQERANRTFQGERAQDVQGMIRGLADLSQAVRTAEAAPTVKRETAAGPYALTPEMEARRQAAAGVSRAPTAYQQYMMRVVNSMPEAEETRSSDELRRDMNRKGVIASGTEKMAAEAAQNLQNRLYDQGYTSALRSLGNTAEAARAAAEAAKLRYQTVSTQRRMEEERAKAAELMQNPDFAEKSQGDAAIADRVLLAASPSEAAVTYWDIYHRNDPKENPKSSNAARYVSDEEAAVYFYLWNTQGARAADAYYRDYLENRASGKKAEAVQADAARYGAYDPVGASIASVGYNAVSGVGLIDIALQNLTRAVGLTDPEKPINYNSPYQMPGIVSDSLRKGVSDYLEERFPKAKIGNTVNVASFLYQTGMSMADSSVAIALNLLGVPEPLTLAAMGASAGTRAIREARERGANDGEALAFGIASAIMESLFEKISLDRILTESNAHNLAQSLRNTLKQGLTEGSEEAMTTIANTVADQIILGDRSELFRKQQELMERGVGEKEALGAAFKEWGTELLGDAVGGFISGVGMGGTKEFSGAAGNPTWQWNMPAETARELNRLEKGGLPRETGLTPQQRAQIETAVRERNEREAAEDRAWRPEKTGNEGTPHPSPAGDTFPQGKAETKETVVSQGTSEGTKRREAAGLRLPEAAREESETIANPALRLPEQRQENRQTGESGLRIADSEQQRTAQRRQLQTQGAPAESLRDRGFENAGEEKTVYVRSEETWDDEERAIAERLRAGGTEPLFVTGLLKNSEGQKVSFLRYGDKLALQADNRRERLRSIVSRATGITIEEMEGNQNGKSEAQTADAGRAAARDQLFDGGPGRISDERAGKPTEERRRQTLGQLDRANRRRAGAASAERVNAREALGIREVKGETRILREENWDEELKSTARSVERATGIPVTYVLGGIELESGGIVRGVNTGTRIILQCDHSTLSVKKLAAHEAYHSFAREDPGLNTRIRERIIEQKKGAALGKTLRTYVEKLGPVYGLTENMDAESFEAAVERILEEIYADAYAGINAFGENAVQFQQETRETVRAARGTENAEATERRTGPPEERYSFAGQKAREADRQNLAKAERMEQSGEDSEKIRQETGWFRGDDGIWRFEIDDSGMRYSRRGDAEYLNNPEYREYQDLWDKIVVQMNASAEELERMRELDKKYKGVVPLMQYKLANGGAKLGDIINHDALFRNYPKLKNTGVEFAELKEGTNGQYNKARNVIELSYALQEAPEDTLIHEIQHVIQNIEGFASGASPEYWANNPVIRADAKEKVQAAKDRVAQVEEKFRKEWPNDEINLNLARKYDDLTDQYFSDDNADLLDTMQKLNEIENAAKEAGFADLLDEYLEARGLLSLAEEEAKRKIVDPNRLYIRTAGEIEARDAASRRNMTQEQRLRIRPNVGSEDIVFANSGTAIREDAGDRNFRYSVEDADYLAAVKAGDMETAQRMVDEAAERAFPDSTVRDEDGKLLMVYHGGEKNYTVFDRTKGRSNMDIQGTFFTPWELDAQGYGSNVRRFFLNLINPADESTGYHALNRYKGQNGAGIKAREYLAARGYDGVNNGGEEYIAFTSEQIKSADPVTYDDDGNVIPLSERFRQDNPDIRFSVEEDVPESSAEYDRREREEEYRAPQSSAEYEQLMRKREEKRQELRRLEKKGQDAQALRQELREADRILRGELGDAEKAENEARIAELEAEIARRSDRAYQEKLFREQGAEALAREVSAVKRLRSQAEKLRNPKMKQTVPKSSPTIAKKDLRNRLTNAFSIPASRRAETGRIIDAAADRMFRDGRLEERERKALFDKLYSEGVMTVPADDMYRAGRELVKGGRIYVPERVKQEFGDDWADFRKAAFAEGILLTNSEEDRSTDSWNAELAEEFPGLFRADDYDQRDVLERIVRMAQEGRGEKLSFAEYAARSIGQEFISEDEIMDHLERQMDEALRSFADKAGLEIYFRDRESRILAGERERFGEILDRREAQEAARRAKEREQRKEAARKQAMDRELREMQQRTLKQLQWLSKNQYRFPEQMQDKAKEILSDLDVYAVSAANEAHLDKASNKTWRELADIYKDARANDPNFLPSKELERIVARLDNRKIGDLDIDALRDLYKAAVGLRTELYNRNNVIGDELHQTFQEVYDGAKKELQSAPKGYRSGVKGLWDTYANDLQLTPLNVFQRMAGWNPDSNWFKVGKMLEKGERDSRRFRTEAARMLAPFLEENREWVKKADGQGKDAVWYEIEVPELLELGMGDKPIFGDTVKVWMTPAQKVHMYLESQNYDNLRHMTGGRTFADRELYSQGKRTEAFAQGKTIRLAPETVKNLVKDLTPEEKALADALRPFYNDYSKREINRVSNLLLGYDKAMEGDYAPIYTNQNYTKSEPGIFDTTAEGVGNLKSRVVSANPSLNISALDAFEKSVDRTSRYVGLAVPVRNVNALMNWREKNDSMKDVISHTWGEQGNRFVNDLLTELQSGREDGSGSIEKLTNAALSRYISAVFGANPSIVLKQFASYPLAGTYLGWENMPLNIPRAARVDTDLMSKYTGELDYRLLGYATPETATLKDNPGRLREKGPLNFLLGGGAITWMDGFTVRTLWTWAENKVQREQPELELGTREQIDAGQSEYYRAVAREFEEAVSRSQPMYDVMHRANIMRESNPITRAFTLFKTVPMQEYNMLRQAVGEAQYAKENNLDKETQAAARRKAGRAFAGILAGNLMIGAITVLNALWKNRGKKYRNEEGKLSAGKLIAEAGKQYFKDAAGLVVGGDAAADLLSSVLFGDKWYGLETPGMEQIGSILEELKSAGESVAGLVRDSVKVLAEGGNWGQYMADHSDTYISAAESAARTLGTYATGLPIDNVKAYLLGALQWMSPEIKTAYEDVMKKADRSGLKGLRGAALEIRVRHILQDRAGGAEPETMEALAALYEAGYTAVVPAAQSDKISVNGEDRALNIAQQQTYKNVWKETVRGELDELVKSEAFQSADAAGQAGMLKRLYSLATERAKSVLFDDYESSSLAKAEAIQTAGGSLADWAAIDGATSGQSRAESYDTIVSAEISEEAKLAAIGNIMGTDMETESGNPTQWARLNQAVEDGLSVQRAVELLQGGLLDDYAKWKESPARTAGVSLEVYLDYREATAAMTGDKDENGKTISGSKKAKVVEYINALPITAAQKDSLFAEWNYSGLEDTPWHSGGGGGGGLYAPARHRTLRLPSVKDTAEQSSRNSGGLRIPEVRRREAGGGLRIPGAPEERRGGSGLRLPRK